MNVGGGYVGRIAGVGEFCEVPMVGVAEGGDVAGWGEGSSSLGLFVWIATAVGDGRCSCTVEIEDVVSELTDVV